jgi:hypothetical protein
MEEYLGRNHERLALSSVGESEHVFDGKEKHLEPDLCDTFN